MRYDPYGSAWNFGNTTAAWINTSITAGSSTVYPNYGTPVAAAPKREKTPLEWLDAEVERVCELAR